MPHLLRAQAQEAGEPDGEAGRPAPLPEALRCLAAAWRRASAATVAEHGGPLAEAIAQALNPGKALDTGSQRNGAFRELALQGSLYSSTP